MQRQNYMITAEEVSREHGDFTVEKVLRCWLMMKWVRTRMEMNPAREWYLVGTPYCGDLEYVQARIPE